MFSYSKLITDLKSQFRHRQLNGCNICYIAVRPNLQSKKVPLQGVKKKKGNNTESFPLDIIKHYF
jgi:hypothetical protein